MTGTLGRQHPTIRRLRALRRDARRRREESVFVAEGIHLAQTALAADADVELVVSSPRLAATAEGRALLEQIGARGLPHAETGDDVLDRIQDARTAQPVLTLVRRRVWPADAGIATQGPRPLVVVAVGIQDPGNLGGVVRTADAAGATACLIQHGSADPFHPRAVRATMGAIFRLPLHAGDAVALLTLLREHRLRLFGTDPAGSRDYDRCDFTGPAAILLGAEGSGLPASWITALDERVRIPMRAAADSLSVGAAAAVVLFEAARQRRGGAVRACDAG